MDQRQSNAMQVCRVFRRKAGADDQYAAHRPIYIFANLKKGHVWIAVEELGHPAGKFRIQLDRDHPLEHTGATCGGNPKISPVSTSDLTSARLASDRRVKYFI